MLNLTEHQETLSRQLPKNLIANSLYFIINIIIGLLLVPFFIDTLGIASYGIIPLATSMTSYVNLITQSFNSSVARYLTIDLQKQDYKKANITFNTSLFGTFGITFLMIPLVLIISYYSLIFFDIPVKQKQDAFILFIGVIGALLIRTWGSNFGVSLFAFNRLDLQNIINTVNIILQTALIFVFFSLDAPKLSYIGHSYLIAAITTFFITAEFSKKVNPHFKINITDFRLSQVKDLGVTGGWIIIDQIGTLLLFQMDIIVVNKLFGTAAGGEYSIVLMWNTLIRSAAGMLAGVLTPVILTYYAKEKFEDIINLSKNAVKLMGLTMALPVGIICGFSPIILSLWVGPEFSKLSPLMWLLIGPLSANMAVLTLFPINVSYNKVSIPAIVTIFSGICNLLLAISLPSITGWGYYGVAIAGAIVLTIRHVLFIPIYATKILGISKNPYISPLIQIIISTSTVAVVANFICNFLNITNPIQFALCCGLICLFYVITMWIVFMSASERIFIRSLILKKYKTTH